MPDNDIVKVVLDAVGATAAARSSNRGSSRCHDEDCETPDQVFYFIFCRCVTINNGACEDWEFCESRRSCRE
jgi:hypothetical protein